MLDTERRPIGTIGYLGGIMALPEPFVWAWSQMIINAQETLCQPGEYVHIDRSTYSLHDTARNQLAQRMQGDWLLQLDTDMTFDPDLASRLVMRMLRYDLDVVCGLYAYKVEPFYPTLYCWNQTTDKYEVVGSWDKTCDLIEVGSAGGGLLLVRRRVFDEIRSQLHEEPFARIMPFGEDHSFFRRLQKIGRKGYCAWKVQAGHLRYESVGPKAKYDAAVINTYDMQGIQVAGTL
jgi:Glycosyl transferase family 2